MATAAKTELLGGQVPTKPIGWIALVLALWTAVGGFLGIVYFYFKWVGGGDFDALKRILEGLIFPLGWLLWSAVLLYDEVTVTRLLIVVAGMAIIVGSGILLIKRSRD